MKTNITFDSNNYYFETMVNHESEFYYMECKALETDGYEMVNNGWIEDGANYTVYHKIVTI